MRQHDKSLEALFKKIKTNKKNNSDKLLGWQRKVILRILQRKYSSVRGTQREYSSKPLKHIIVKRILVFKRYTYTYFYPLNIFHLFAFPSGKSSDPKIIGIKTYLFEISARKKVFSKFQQIENFRLRRRGKNQQQCILIEGFAVYNCGKLSVDSLPTDGQQIFWGTVLQFYRLVPMLHMSLAFEIQTRVLKIERYKSSVMMVLYSDLGFDRNLS